jgi:hypothetical protein
MQRTMALIAWGSTGAGGALALTRIFARNFAKFGELDLATHHGVDLLAGFAMLADVPARKALRVGRSDAAVRIGLAEQSAAGRGS